MRQSGRALQASKANENLLHTLRSLLCLKPILSNIKSAGSFFRFHLSSIPQASVNIVPSKVTAGNPVDRSDWEHRSRVDSELHPKVDSGILEYSGALCSSRVNDLNCVTLYLALIDVDRSIADADVV